MRFDFTRGDWRPNPPISGPYSFLWSPIRYFVVHQVGGGPRWDPGPGLDVAQHLRNGQHGWWTNRGYSFGYTGAVVDVDDHELDGTSWEIRGDTWRGAATGGVNAIVVAFLVISRDDKPCGPKATATLRRLYSEAQELAADAHPGRALEIWGHNEVPGGTTRTTCPGTGRRQQVAAGVFYPLTLDPPPSSEPEEPEMILIRDRKLGADHGGVFTLDGTPISEPALARLLAQGAVVVDQDHDHWRAATRHRLGPAAGEYDRPPRR